MNNEFEFNWYLVITDAFSMFENTPHEICKTGKRLYPIGGIIPIIDKVYGCRGLAKILSIRIDESETEVEFEIIKSFKKDSEIAKHYFNMYIEMKNVDLDDKLI